MTIEKTIPLFVLILFLGTTLFLVQPVKAQSWNTIETYNNSIQQGSSWNTIETFNNSVSEGTVIFDEGNLDNWVIDLDLGKTSQLDVSLDSWNIPINDYYNWKTIETYLNKVSQGFKEGWNTIEVFSNEIEQLGEWFSIETYLNQISQGSSWKTIETYLNEVEQLGGFRTIETYTNPITESSYFRTVETFTNNVTLLKDWVTVESYANTLYEGVEIQLWRTVETFDNKVEYIDISKPLVPLDTLVKNVVIPLCMTLLPAFAIQESLPKKLSYWGFVMGFTFGIFILGVGFNMNFGVWLLLIIADGLLFYKGGLD